MPMSVNLPAGSYFCNDGLLAGGALRPAGFAIVANSARETPATTINRPIKTRRLKKADCEADFFFMAVS